MIEEYNNMFSFVYFFGGYKEKCDVVLFYQAFCRNQSFCKHKWKVNPNQSS